MLYTHFEIKNFKGINNTKLDISTHPSSKIHCLVGLNESGKTTILEAINYFTYNSDKLTALDLKGYTIDNPNNLIPISLRSNYTGNITVSVELELNDADEIAIAKDVKAESGFEITQKIENIYISQIIRYKDSKFSRTNVEWTLSLRGRKAKGRSYFLTYHKNRDLWLKVVNVIKKHIPGILFFPNFLFDFPSKIYLEDIETDYEKHKFYRNVVQDILDGIGNRANVQTHIVARAKSNDQADKISLNQLLLTMARHVSQNVFSQWGNISRSKNDKKKVTINHGMDQDGRVYLEFNIEDVDGLYLITERSLGFRWFFVFFLLTYYRSHRAQAGGNVLFLFDEPASNLHQTAQAQLLDIFGKIGVNSQIIYTTHSHHLINPKWLDSTHIVRNEGLHDPSLFDELVPTKTRIAVHKYRTFSTQHPDQSAYFQPILDVLDYRPSQLELVPDIIMVEGKSDYYILRYFQEIIAKQKHPINILPGTGSGSLTTVIQLYLAWGKNFLVLLDDDKEGKKQRDRYFELFGSAINPFLYSLADVDPSFRNREIEDLADTNDKLLVQRFAYPSDALFNKTHFQRAIQEALINNHVLPLNTGSTENFQKVFRFCLQKLKVAAAHTEAHSLA